jgi:sn-glycerol 3-phosphate transport system ATP-binding protein
MARAMIKEPQVFLFDEPLSNLDAKLRVQMRIEIRRLHQRLGGTSVFVTHDQIEAMTLADRLIVMNAGRVEQVGTPKEVYRRPASLFVAGFIGSPAMNILSAKVAPGGRLALASGAAIACEAALGLPLGSEVALGIRPEDVEILPAEAEDALALPVEFVEELGAGHLLHGTLEGRDFVVALGAGVEPPAAQRIALRLPARALHLFEPGTGFRLDAQPAAPRAEAPAAGGVYA